MQIPNNALVVVADGEGARVFRNSGDGGKVSLQQHDLLELMDANDDGPAGVQPAESGGADIDKATFAKQLANRLNRGALRNEYEALVLIADAGTLGEMRPLLHKEVQQRLVREMSKDLTNSPLTDIERALS